MILHQFQIRKKLAKSKDNFPTNISVEFSDISIGISNQNINSVCLDLERVKCKVAKKGLLGALFFFFFKPSVLLIDCFAFRDFRRWHCWKHLVLLNKAWEENQIDCARSLILLPVIEIWSLYFKTKKTPENWLLFSLGDDFNRWRHTISFS